MIDPSTTLAHREPALVLDAVSALGQTTLSCTGGAGRRLHWAQILDGCAQTAGLLARALLASPEPVAFVVASYESVELGEGHDAHDGGVIEWRATPVRRVGDFHQVDVRALDEGGRALVVARVALARRPAT